MYQLIPLQKYVVVALSEGSCLAKGILDIDIVDIDGMLPFEI